MDRNFVIKLTELKGFLLNCARIPVFDAQEVTQPTKQMSINRRFVMDGYPGMYQLTDDENPVKYTYNCAG